MPGHKYIKKYMNSNGNWTYIYDLPSGANRADERSTKDFNYTNEKELKRRGYRDVTGDGDYVKGNSYVERRQQGYSVNKKGYIEPKYTHRIGKLTKKTVKSDKFFSSEYKIKTHGNSKTPSSMSITHEEGRLERGARNAKRKMDYKVSKASKSINKGRKKISKYLSKKLKGGN